MEAVIAIVTLALVVFEVAVLWQLFTKAGQPGWAALVPLYNLYCLIQVAGRPDWWLILLFIPLVNMVVSIIVALDIARNFGKSIAFGIGLVILPIVFYPILAFGSAQYGGAPR